MPAVCACSSITVFNYEDKLEDWRRTTNKAVLAQQGNRYDLAESHFQDALSQSRRFGAADLLVARSLVNLADAYVQEGRYGEAEPLYKASLPIFDANLASTTDEDRLPLLQELLATLTSLADVAQELHKSGESKGYRSQISQLTKQFATTSSYRSDVQQFRRLRLFLGFFESNQLEMPTHPSLHRDLGRDTK